MSSITIHKEERNYFSQDEKVRPRQARGNTPRLTEPLITKINGRQYINPPPLTHLEGELTRICSPARKKSRIYLIVINIYSWTLML